MNSLIFSFRFFLVTSHPFIYNFGPHDLKHPLTYFQHIRIQFTTFPELFPTFLQTLLMFTLRSGSPAMEAGVASLVWELEEIVGLADWNLPSTQGFRGRSGVVG